MRLKHLAFSSIVILGLMGCSDEQVSPPETTNYTTPEEALLELNKDEDRKLKVYDSIRLRDDFAITVFRGYMNDEDIWLANTVSNEREWKVTDLVLLDQRSEGHYTDEESRYEISYGMDDSTDFKADEKMILIEAEGLKIAIKDLGAVISD